MSECLDCGKEIGKAKKCSCGWKASEVKVYKQAARNYRCNFPGCTNAGTITLHTTGPAPGEDDFRKWHCREHWRPNA